jgi:hypothetical protein
LYDYTKTIIIIKKNSVVANFATVQTENGRLVKRQIAFSKMEMSATELLKNI